MTLTQLRYLSAIVDAGLNATMAAQRLNASQSALSKQIKALEEELGFLLFVRRGKSFERLTDGGAEVLECARALMIQVGNIRTLSANRRGEARGELRIAATFTQARFVLPAPLATIRARFPEVRLHVSPGMEAEAYRSLQRGAVDLAVVSAPDHPPGSEIAIPLYRWALVGVVPRTHQLAGKPSLSLAELAWHPLISYPSLLDPGSPLSADFEEAGLAPQIACVASDSDLIKSFVRAGLGFGLIAEMALGPGDADLAVFPLDGLVPLRTAWAVLPRERAVRDHLRDLLTELAPRLTSADLRRILDGERVDPSAAPRWDEAAAWLGSAAPS